jgi:hypothetical protein
MESSLYTHPDGADVTMITGNLPAQAVVRITVAPVTCHFDVSWTTDDASGRHHVRAVLDDPRQPEAWSAVVHAHATFVAALLGHVEQRSCRAPALPRAGAAAHEIPLGDGTAFELGYLGTVSGEVAGSLTLLADQERLAAFGVNVSQGGEHSRLELTPDGSGERCLDLRGPRDARLSTLLAMGVRAGWQHIVGGIAWIS